ncbi:MAG: rhodanese-like domain-containing protein [Hyphomonadaceae bacterium]|nr:rhodanese-like domain-containing protein [Hyphomonadaceae bacterium]
MKLTNIDVHKAHKLIEERPALTILDIRTAEEFEMSFIENAVNIDVKSELFELELSKLDKSKDYLVHCHSGQRCVAAIPVFKKLGFKHIIHMEGGMREWAHAELPTVYNWFI